MYKHGGFVYNAIKILKMSCFEITWNSEPLVHRFSQVCCFQIIPVPFYSNYRSNQKID